MQVEELSEEDEADGGGKDEGGGDDENSDDDDSDDDGPSGFQDPLRPASKKARRAAWKHERQEGAPPRPLQLRNQVELRLPTHRPAL